jgi:site-specific DNA-methyltransferase (adenine-specific)
MVDDPLYSSDGISLHYGDVMDCYNDRPSPVVIVSDGPYGLGLFPGDPPTEEGLADWYEPHIEMWSEKATPLTTLWFWNSELGWANVHSVLQKHGWRYRCCNIWDKGMAHVAGNCNTQRLRKLPVVTEVCVQYVKEPVFEADGRCMTMQEWLRYEWERSGVPLYKANEACGVANAATRKYLTQCHLW